MEIRLLKLSFIAEFVRKSHSNHIHRVHIWYDERDNYQQGV